MKTTAKRHREVDDSSGAAKKSKEDEGSNNARVALFLQWCESNHLTVNSKVEIGTHGSCAHNGMVARQLIHKAEVLFEVPRFLLLHPTTSAINDLLQSEANNIQSESGWVPLLLALMHEYSSENSKWKPYFKIVPDFQDLDLPMFWPQGDIQKELRGTGVPEAVEKDNKSIEMEFNHIVLPFVKKYPAMFSDCCYDLHFYKQMVAFVMAYSFTEPSKDEDDSNEDEENDVVAASKPLPMMVPMADILNHVAKNNAHLDFGENSLKMVATEDIEPGSEVFNTYGQLSNHQLLHMYGFAEAFPNNHYDTVDISMSYLFNIIKEGKDSAQLKVVEKKCNFLKKMGLADVESTCVVGMDGILTEDELIQELKVLLMDESEFRALSDNDDSWLEDDEDFDLSREQLSKLPEEWKDCLERLFKAKLQEYTSSLAVEEPHMGSLTTLKRRQRFATHVRYGQLQIMNTLLKALKLQ